MPVYPRIPGVNWSPLKLAMAIATGIWLGFVAVALTALLIYKTLPSEQPPPPDEATTNWLTPPAADAESQSDTAMFDKYRRNLRDSEARQTQEAEQADRQRSFNGPKCQFWMQQNQTAPSEKSRAAIYQFCG